jgi:anaerobic ribonucleoside-triphosphate reductase activating protein
MQIHATISASEVNGPGRRAVVWFQGCNLKCPGCWNPATHGFGLGSEHTVQSIGDRLLACADIEGVTFSGGEPFQQAESLLDLCEYLKSARPDFSIGLFSGYTIRELVSGRWQHHSDRDSRWHQGSGALFERIRSHLDFGVFGRFNQAQQTADKPLCGSRNQKVVFFTNRYSSRDLRPQACEINISADGEGITITGFPPKELVRDLLAR